MTYTWLALMLGVWLMALAVKHVGDTSYTESVIMFAVANASLYYVARRIER
jgi:hypothetical protein